MTNCNVCLFCSILNENFEEFLPSLVNREFNISFHLVFGLFAVILNFDFLVFYVLHDKISDMPRVGAMTGFILFPLLSRIQD